MIGLILGIAKSATISDGVTLKQNRLIAADHHTKLAIHHKLGKASLGSALTKIGLFR
ncbi:MAG: hypothetical protein RIR37_1039 [Verrucomicrobiota bacterium]